MRQIGFDRMRSIPTRTAAPGKIEPVSEFEDLAMPLAACVYNFARWLVGNDHDVEDLVQETYLKAFRSFSSFQSGTNFRAWILRILRNAYLDSRSTLERRMTVALNIEDELPLLRDNCPGPESLLIEKYDIAAIREAIEQLPLPNREVILMCDVEDFTYREIAQILDIPIGTVMSRLARARKVVRQALRPPQIEVCRESVSHY